MKYEIKVFNNTVHRFQVMAVWKRFLDMQPVITNRDWL